MQTAITLVTILGFLTYGFTAIKASILILDLKKNLKFENHWSGRINIKGLKITYNNLVVKSSEKTKILKVIFLLRISKVAAYSTFAIVVLLIIFGKK